MLCFQYSTLYNCHLQAMWSCLLMWRMEGSLYALENWWHSPVGYSCHFLWNGAVHTFLQSPTQLKIHLRIPLFEVQHLKLILYRLAAVLFLEIPILLPPWGWLNPGMKFLSSAWQHKILKQQPSHSQVLNLSWGYVFRYIHIFRSHVSFYAVNCINQQLYQAHPRNYQWNTMNLLLHSPSHGSHQKIWATLILIITLSM